MCCCCSRRLRRSARLPGVDGLAGFAAWVTWPARWSWRRASTLIKRAAFYHRPLSVALRRFADEWWPVAQPLLVLQGQRLFHLASAALAVGLLAGFYVRGIALEYRAGWESTFLGPAQVQALLHWIYGLAAAVTGIDLPATPEATAALHWRKGMGGGPAAPWIHLMAVTALLLVVLPRLALAGWMSWQLRQRGARVAVPESLVPYARVALRDSDAAPAAQTARLTAYAYEPASASEQGLQHLLRAVFGPDTRLDFAPRVAYGDEASLDAPLPGPAPDLDILLFSLAATPEAENHGALLLGARDRLARQRPGARLLVLVDEAPYLARMRGDASLAARIAERRAAWHDFVQGHGLAPCCIDLAALAGDGGSHAADWSTRCCAPCAVAPHERGACDDQHRAAVAHQRRQDHAGTDAAAAGHRRRDGPRARHRGGRGIRADAQRRGRSSHALGHARVRRQRAPATTPGRERPAARLVPVAGVGPFADRAFWCSQQALRAARDSADVVLYVVNATEDPAAAGYIEPELRILDWLGKPALLLLNQLGTRGDPAQDRPLAEQWGAFLRRQPTTVRAADPVVRCLRALLGAGARAAGRHRRGAAGITAASLYPRRRGLACARPRRARAQRGRDRRAAGPPGTRRRATA